MNPVRRNELVELKYNRGTWHIFHPTQPQKQQCLCGHTQRNDYQRNHCQKKRKASKILENPEPWIGTVALNGRRKLEKLIQEWEKITGTIKLKKQVEQL